MFQRLFLALIAVIGISSFEEVAHADTCETSSRGYSFQESSWSSSDARNAVLNRCYAHPYTNNDECRYNVSCSSDSGGGSCSGPGGACHSVRDCCSGWCTSGYCDSSGGGSCSSNGSWCSSGSECCSRVCGDGRCR